MAERKVSVDGQLIPVPAEPYTRSTAWWLRDVGFTSVTIGCEEGACGSCTVLLDGHAVPSCVLPLGRLADGAHVETNCPEAQLVLDTLRAADAIQCGFCVPGIVSSCAAALRRDGRLPDDPLGMRHVMAGHRCRCTGYHAFVAALRGLAVEA